MESDEFQAKTASFLAWLGRIGVHHSPKVALVDLRSAGRGRGLVAQSDIGEDEVLFTIPRDAVLNSTTALGSADNPAILEMPCWLALTAIILTEGQQEDSKWAPYLALLPSRLDSLVFWSESELLELQASTVVKKIGRASAEQLFIEHISPLGLSNTNTEMFHKVASVIMAYAFDIPEEKGHDDPESPADGDDLVSDNEEEEKTILSMIPLADMLNADADGNNARLCCDNEELEMRSIKPISKGEEILNDYGQLPRSDLLRRYGYISDKYAAYDVAELSTQSLLASLSKEQPLLAGGILQPLSREKLEQRVELAQREGVYEDSYDLTHPGPDDPSIPDDLLALLYILLLDNENLAAIETSHASLPSRSKLATSLVGQILTKILESRKQEYATTIEADQAILQADNLPSRKRMAVEVRLGEKLVLEKAIQEAQSLAGDNKRMRFKQETPTNSAAQHAKGKRKPEEDGSGRKKVRLR